MTLGAAGRVNSAVNLVLPQVIAAMRQHPLGRIGKFVARFELFLVCMAVDAKRFLMTGGACLTGICGVKLMFQVEVERLVIHEAVGVGVAFGAIGQAGHFLRMNDCHAIGTGTGVEN